MESDDACLLFLKINTLQSSVLVGETGKMKQKNQKICFNSKLGSGKTTMICNFLLDHDGFKKNSINIALTQPRRVVSERRKQKIKFINMKYILGRYYCSTSYCNPSKLHFRRTSWLQSTI